MGFLDDAFDVVHGGASTVADTAGFLGDVLTGDVHGAVTNGSQVIGDVNDVLQGLEGLGASLGQVPRRFAESTLVKLTDSPPIDAALMAIEAMKATTGSGAPEDGEGFRASAHLLEEAVDLLIDAKPHDDRWSGDASGIYLDRAVTHKNLTSRVQVADGEIQRILSDEADEVSRTRSTLDNTSQYLQDFALSTSWMNVVPGGRAAKLSVDSAAAAAGLATATFTVANLAQASFSNAAKIRSQLHHYQDAAQEKLDLATGACDPFIDAKKDIQPGHRPRRLDPRRDYEVPTPLEPIPFGPPATPYGVTATPPATAGSAPPSPTPSLVIPTQAQRVVGRGRTAAAAGSTPAPPSRSYRRQETSSGGARAAGVPGERAPLGAEQQHADQVTATPNGER